LASPFNSCIHSIFGWIIRGVQSCFIKCVRSYGCIYPCGKNVHLSSTLVFKLSLTIGLVYIVFFGWRWNIERWKKSRFCRDSPIWKWKKVFFYTSRNK
jgi:hypothetical protein